MELDASKTPLEQAQQLSEILGYKIHGVVKPVYTVDDKKWVEFSVMVPDGTLTGFSTRWQMLKMFWKIMKGRV